MTWTEKAELERTESEFLPAAAEARKLAIVRPSQDFKEKTFGTSGNPRNKTLKKRDSTARYVRWDRVVHCTTITCSTTNTHEINQLVNIIYQVNKQWCYLGETEINHKQNFFLQHTPFSNERGGGVYLKTLECYLLAVGTAYEAMIWPNNQVV